ncbi:sigma-54-dependent transcriptional regulator [Thalassolituus sp. LLYu03]|uniref:sigma-54-dependent transcriptional regulator n=1 Tax=Thalassolituus sp. LLYu03 TaxID=3421656 RepID=UPI003D2C0814
MSATPLVLIVDDQPENLDVLVHYLAGSGLNLAVATNGQEALDIAASNPPDLILLDVMMPGLNGYEVCRALKARAASAHTPVIFMSALSDTGNKLEGFNAGAIDYLTKPLQREEVLARIHAHLTIARQQQELEHKNQQLQQLNQELQQQIDRRLQAEDALQRSDATLSALTRQEAERWGIDAFVGQSTAVTQLLDDVRALQQAADTNVLVLGESGTGKELVSRAIHFGSARASRPFIAVNCSAIPAELADAEFFGHTKGAYTGATSDRRGFFEQADGGTLFLDEIGDMPLALQAKLLRVLEDGLVTPIGGRQSRKVNVRVVAATNVGLRERVQSKAFRQDLYFRLCGYCIDLPPLRQRPGDVPLLAGHFLHQLSRQMGRDCPQLTAAALAALSAYHYPGNVRELRNMVEFALIASRGQPIARAHLHFMEPLADNGLLATSPAAPVVTNPPVTAAPVATQPLSAGGTLPESTAPTDTLAADEERLLAHARQFGRIDNTAAQTLLAVDHGRASYLLKKLHKDGQLAKQGERRWAYYTPV